MESSVEWSLLGKMLLAMGYGAIIGFERELVRKPAGLRTHMFVAGASALIVLLSEIIVQQFVEMAPDAVRADPIRVFEAILVGVSFIGAGTIVQREAADRIEGLTTAASLLMVSGIGIAVALDMPLLAGAVTLAAFVVVHGLRVVEQRLLSRGRD